MRAMCIKHAEGGGSIEAVRFIPVAVEGALVFPSRPRDASKFVGEGDGGFVVAAAPLGGDGPGAQAIE